MADVIWILQHEHMCCGVLEPSRFVELPVKSLAVDHVIQALEFCESRTEAQKLIKQGSIRWHHMMSEGWEWQKVTDFKQPLPTGWPISLHVGNGLYRQVGFTQPDGTIKTRFVSGCRTIMLPETDQTIDHWSELWRNE